MIAPITRTTAIAIEARSGLDPWVQADLPAPRRDEVAVDQVGLALGRLIGLRRRGPLPSSRDADQTRHDPLRRPRSNSATLTPQFAANSGHTSGRATVLASPLSVS
jgi:hypothetical protein